MFAISKVERFRQRYVRAVRSCLNTSFGVPDCDMAGQQRTWTGWLGLKQREISDLRELLRSDVRDVFKARAIAILLAPDLRLVPFAWSDKTSLSNYVSVGSGFSLADLLLPLRTFTLSLLEINIDTALTPNAVDEIRRTLFSYNRYILQALALLPEDDPAAVRLFERYQLNDPVAYYNMEETSGYNPFCDILQANIPEKWKNLADKQMRRIILAEQEGRAKPRKEWEDALQSYTSHIQSVLYTPLLYSIDLFVSQLDFILGVPRIYGKKLFGDSKVRAILRLLDGEPHKHLRHRFARYVMTEDRNEHVAFGVYDENTRAAATMMLNEFGDEDPELGDRLRVAIAIADERVREGRARAEAWQTREGAVLAQMR